MLPLETLMKMYKERLRARTPTEGTHFTGIKGFEIHRTDSPKPPKTCFIKPKIIVLVQGGKRSIVGTEEFVCREGQLLIACVSLPNTSCAIEIKPGKPGMGMTLELDTGLLSQLALEAPQKGTPSVSIGKGIMIQPLECEIVDALLRLEALIDQPEHIPILAPMIIREIHYRLLIGPHGDQLRALYSYGSQRAQILNTVAWLKENFNKPLHIDDLAEMAHMATCTFHRRFKDMTTLSPLQYQKRLRLHEAQRLMIIENVDVNQACEAVGYESLTQFNREYKRFFGEPPRRNVTKWQHEHADNYSLILDD